MSAQRTPTTVAQVVAEALSHGGVDTVFGLVGSGNLVLINALRATGASYVAARDEGGATAMADGWARTTGGVGVVSVHQGPGLTNTLTALAEAAKSRTPLLLIAADTPAAALRSNFRIDQHDLVASVGAEVHHFADLGEDVGPARFAAVDLAAVAEALGSGGVTVRETGDLAAVERWLADGSGPLVVDAKVDPDVRAAWLEDAFRAG